MVPRKAWIELLVGAAILTTLASIIVPEYLRHIRRGKTLEASNNITRVFQSSVAYYETEHLDAAHRILDRQFPASTATTPALGSCCGQPGDRCDPGLSAAAWKAPTWTALSFSLDEPFYYSYKYESAGVNETANFSAWA